MLVGRQALAAGREFLLEAGQLSRVAVKPPESPRHPEQPHRRLDVAVREPGHRGPQIVMLSLQPVEPAELPPALYLGGGRLGEREEVGRVPIMGVRPVSAVAQALQRIVPDRLQQPEPRLAAAGLLPDQAAVHQRAQRVDYLHGLPRIRRGSGRVAADGLHGSQVERARKHSETGQQRLPGRREQVEAPVQGASQGSLALWQITRAARQQPQPVVEPGQQRLRRQHPDPGSGKLDGQRQSVQPAADLRDGPGVVAGQLEVRSRGVRPLREQPDRGVLLRGRGVRIRPGLRHREGWHGKLMLTADPQHCPAGYQRDYAGRRAQQGGHQRSGVGHLLEVVEQQQQLPGVQVRLQVAEQPAARRAQPEPGGDRGGDQVSSRDRRQVERTALLPGTLTRGGARPREPACFCPPRPGRSA